MEKHQIQVVCHQIQSPDNLGSIARAMANFGFESLRLSSPETTEFEKAYKMAVKADFIVKNMNVYNDLRSSVSDCVYALGTTSRDDVRRRVCLSPREGIQRLLEASRDGRVALVLGGERRGLSDDELGVCQDVVAIPTSDVQPSMNIAQAATVLLYLISEATWLEPNTASETRANLGSMHALEDRLKLVLLQSGFLNPQGPEYIMGELFRSLERAQLSQRESELWLSATSHLLRMLRNQR